MLKYSFKCLPTADARRPCTPVVELSLNRHGNESRKTVIENHRQSYISLHHEGSNGNAGQSSKPLTTEVDLDDAVLSCWWWC